MKYTKSILLVTILLVAIFNSCKNEEPEIPKSPTPPDTVWTESTVVRDVNTIYYHNDIEKLMITKCAVDGYLNKKDEIGCHSNTFDVSGVTLDNYHGVLEEVDKDFDPNSSDLYEALSEDGDKKMPQKGGISDEEAFMIRDWISQGAQDNICNPCSDYTIGSFRNSVAIILYKNCSGCHNEITKRGELSFFRAYPDSKDNIDTASVKAASGLILEAIVGINKSRMPKYIDPLFECEYEAIKAWVDNGMIID